MSIVKFENNYMEISEMAGKVVKKGGIVLAPFDTVYGFVCDPKNDKALLKIFKLKEREQSKTIGIAVDHTMRVQKFSQSKLWDFTEGKVPGPYTFIVNANERVLSKYCYKDNTLAFRIPNAELIYEVILESDGIIAQTSANKAGKPNCFSIDDIRSQFREDELDTVDLIIDEGKIENSKPSEIWDLTGETPKKIER